MKKIKNITRMEYRNPYGWWVRFSFDNKKYSKFFNDKKFGGKESALLSAYAWMKNTKKKANIPDSPLWVGGGARGVTGIRGVSFCSKSKAYFATWCDAEGKPGAKRYSVKRYGEEKALSLACAKRKEMEELRLCGFVAPVKPYAQKTIRDTKKYTKDELIELLWKKQFQLGRLPTSRDFKKIKPNYDRFCKAFGSWNNAIKAAGLRD